MNGGNPTSGVDPAEVVAKDGMQAIPWTPSPTQTTRASLMIWSEPLNQRCYRIQE